MCPAYGQNFRPDLNAEHNQADDANSSPLRNPEEQFLSPVPLGKAVCDPHLCRSHNSSSILQTHSFPFPFPRVVVPWL